jgi:vacuolar-type H+-ATPase subunit E/Vma4
MSDLAAASKALLEDARRQAESALAAADDDAETTLRRAREQAEAMLADARARGSAEGRVSAAREADQAAVLARMQVLAARRQAYEQLQAGARDAALALRDEPGYPELVERLAAAARRDLGDGAEVERDPPGAGGIRAHAGSRHVDYTLEALADRCVLALGPVARRLWE